jgi:tripartite-type tricarboxylate transporter receptor subunit TctC
MTSIVAFRSMLALMAAVVVALATPAAAQDARWPSRPVKIVVTFPPGGTSDLVARLLAPRLSTAFGQQFIVENRPGAAGIIGADVVAKSAPDGHTLLISTVGSHGIAPTLNRNIKYDAMADFTHIALIGSTAHVLLVSPKLPAKSLQEFIALAKSKPGKIDFGSGGTGTINHIAGELFKTKAGIDITHVSYKGSGAAIIDLRGNTIPAAFDALPANVGMIRSGELRALAITSAQRSPLAPQVPTFAEQGFPDVIVDNWVGLSGPARLPDDPVKRLASEMQKALEATDVRAKMQEWGMTITYRGPAEFTSFVRADIARWRPVVIASGAQVD